MANSLGYLFGEQNTLDWKYGIINLYTDAVGNKINYKSASNLFVFFNIWIIIIIR